MKFEDLVRATGATVVDYETKLECCGGALDRVGQRESALEFCARKVEDLSGQEVDALVVACPSCFQQFDLNQAAMLRRRQKEGAGEDVGIPVLYYSELVALAMGRDPEDLGLSLHRGDVSPFLENWGRRLEQKEEIERAFRVSELQKCNECRACEMGRRWPRPGATWAPLRRC